MPLYLPSQLVEGPLMVCRVKTKDGFCGKVFRAGEERKWQRHTAECARENIDHILAASPRRKLPFLDEEAWDPEYSAYMRKVGDRMKAEGRFEFKPGEA